MTDISRENLDMSKMDGSKEQNLNAQSGINDKELERKFDERSKVITEVYKRLFFQAFIRNA